MKRADLKNRKRCILALSAGLILCATPAFASMTEYYTYGGFDPVTTAFKNIALIFSGDTYRGMVSAFAILGFVFGGIMIYLKMAVGQAKNTFSWLIPVMLGMALYSSMFIPTTSLAVYDPVYNQNVVIDQVPVGVVYTASLVNHIERFIVETLDTNAPIPGPVQLNYQDHGGAVGVQVLYNSVGEAIQDSKASQTMQKYTLDCVSFELVRPGTLLTFDLLLDPGSQSQNLLEVLALADNPANYTTSYLGGAPAEGAAKSCKDTYADLKAFYGNPANATKALANACGSAGFLDGARCQTLMAEALQVTLGIAIDPAVFVANNTISLITTQSMLTMGGAETAQYLTQIQQNQNGVGGGIIAGMMNPRMIDAYMAYTIAIIPLIAMFIPTPMWQQAFGLILSMLLWNMLLRSLDVVTFHLWANDYVKAMAGLKDVGAGVEAYLRMPMAGTKYLGQFATMRNSIFLLATVISGALFKFGDSALSRIAANAQSNTTKNADLAADRGSAAREAVTAQQNAERAAMMAPLISGSSLMQMSQGAAARELGGMAGGVGEFAASGGNISAHLSNQSQVAKIQTGQSIGYSSGMSLDQALQRGGTEAAGARATLEALGAFGKNATGQAYQNAYTSTMANTASGIATKNQIDRWAKGAGVSEKDAYKGFAAMDMANREGVMKAWGGDVGAYTKFLENSQHLSQGERDAVTKAAGAAGMDLRQFAGNRALIDKMKDVGMIQAVQGGQISEGDLKEMGRTGLLTDAGHMDQWKAVQDATGMGPREATAFVGSHNELKSIAGYQEAEKFANGRGKQFMDLMRAGARSFRMDLSDKEAKSWGLNGKGTYMMAVGDDGKTAFMDQRGGVRMWNGESNVREHTDKTVIDKGVRSTVGDQVWTGSRRVNEHTNIRTNQQYSEVDKLVGAKDVNGINASLAASGSNVRVAAGDTIRMRMGVEKAQNMGQDGSMGAHGPQGFVATVSSFSIQRGGERDFKDYTHDVAGKYREQYDNRYVRQMGVDVIGADSALVRDVAGEKAAQVVFGTLNGSANVINKAGTILRPAAGGLKKPNAKNLPSGKPSRKP